jgi:hypothetical protein
VQRYVLGLVDHPMPAAAEFLDNAVVRDGLSDHQKIRGFRVASSYGRDILWSTNDGSHTVARNLCSNGLVAEVAPLVAANLV